MKVTRTLYAATVPDLLPICKAAGFMGAVIWRRYGALGTAGRTANEIRKDCPPLYKHLDSTFSGATDRQ